jgi:DNA processing protein
MTPGLSPNTQAILMLTAPLLAGRGGSASGLLSPSEYNRLARHLREQQRQPADLLAPDAADLLRSCHSVIDEARLRLLLGRGFLLSQVVEHWQTYAIWVVSRADPGYPRRLKLRLREEAPAVLYGCGDITLLESGGLAVVGSRHVDDVLIDYTESVGRLVGASGRQVVSGGARGVDQAAMRGALEAGGTVVGVLADSLQKTTLNREQRNRLVGGQLLLISPWDPSAGFNVGHAMQRNKLVYALADASLVVSSDLNKGGTWSGAIEQLEKLRLVPVYVRSSGQRSVGLDALREKGALVWPEPRDAADLEAVFATVGAASGVAPSAPEPVDHLASASAAPVVIEAEHGSRPADALFAVARRMILALLTAPMSEAEIAAALEVSSAQTRAWLQRLLDAGFVVRAGTRSKTWAIGPAPAEPTPSHREAERRAPDQLQLLVGG